MEKLPPRLVEWRGQWYVFYYDYLEKRPRRVSCRSLDAFTQAQREKLLRRFQKREKREILEAWRLADSAFKTPLIKALQEYIKHVDEQEKARLANPEARVGLSKPGAYNARLSVKLLIAWLREEDMATLTCDELDATILSRFCNQLASTPYRVGKKASRMRTGATLNRHRTKLGTALRWLDSRRPRLFSDAESFLLALKPIQAQRKREAAYTPKELKDFLKAALAQPKPSTVKRRKGGKVERFSQITGQVPATPVDKLFLLLALTGMRRGEALNLRWRDVDLKAGEILIDAPKTGKWRILPLKGTPEVKVAPKFLRTLKEWAKGKGPDDYVLPHLGTDKPAWPKHAWNRAKGKGRVTPQGLRRTFDNYAISLGVPPAVVAQWLGHSPQVAFAHYRQQVRKRGRAKSIEAAMSLS